MSQHQTPRTMLPAHAFEARVTRSQTRRRLDLFERTQQIEEQARRSMGSPPTDPTSPMHGLPDETFQSLGSPLRRGGKTLKEELEAAAGSSGIGFGSSFGDVTRSSIASVDDGDVTVVPIQAPPPSNAAVSLPPPSRPAPLAPSDISEGAETKEQVAGRSSLPTTPVKQRLRDIPDISQSPLRNWHNFYNKDTSSFDMPFSRGASPAPATGIFTPKASPAKPKGEKLVGDDTIVPQLPHPSTPTHSSQHVIFPDDSAPLTPPAAHGTPEGPPRTAKAFETPLRQLLHARVPAPAVEQNLEIRVEPPTEERPITVKVPKKKHPRAVIADEVDVALRLPPADVGLKYKVSKHHVEPRGGSDAADGDVQDLREKMPPPPLPKVAKPRNSVALVGGTAIERDKLQIGEQKSSNSNAVAASKDRGLHRGVEVDYIEGEVSASGDFFSNSVYDSLNDIAHPAQSVRSQTSTTSFASRSSQKSFTNPKHPEAAARLEKLYNQRQASAISLFEQRARLPSLLRIPESPDFTIPPTERYQNLPLVDDAHRAEIAHRVERERNLHRYRSSVIIARSAKEYRPKQLDQEEIPAQLGNIEPQEISQAPVVVREKSPPTQEMRSDLRLYLDSLDVSSLRQFTASGRRERLEDAFIPREKFKEEFDAAELEKEIYKREYYQAELETVQDFVKEVARDADELDAILQSSDEEDKYENKIIEADPNRQIRRKVREAFRAGRRAKYQEDRIAQGLASMNDQSLDPNRGRAVRSAKMGEIFQDEFLKQIESLDEQRRAEIERAKEDGSYWKQDIHAKEKDRSQAESAASGLSKPFEPVKAGWISHDGTLKCIKPGDIPKFQRISAPWEESFAEEAQFGPIPPKIMWTGIEESDDIAINEDLSWKLLGCVDEFQASAVGGYTDYKWKTLDPSEPTNNSYLYRHDPRFKPENRRPFSSRSDSSFYASSVGSSVSVRSLAEPTSDDVTWASPLLNLRLMLTTDSVHGSNTSLLYDPTELDTPTLDHERLYKKSERRLEQEYPSYTKPRRFIRDELAVTLPPLRRLGGTPKRTSLASQDPRERQERRRLQRTINGRRYVYVKRTRFNLTRSQENLIRGTGRAVVHDSDDDEEALIGMDEHRKLWEKGRSGHPRVNGWSRLKAYLVRKEEKEKMGWVEMAPAVRAAKTRTAGLDRYYPRMLKLTKGSIMMGISTIDKIAKQKRSGRNKKIPGYKSEEHKDHIHHKLAYIMNHVTRFKLGNPTHGYYSHEMMNEIDEALDDIMDWRDSAKRNKKVVKERLIDEYSRRGGLFFYANNSAGENQQLPNIDLGKMTDKPAAAKGAAKEYLVYTRGEEEGAEWWEAFAFGDYDDSDSEELGGEEEAEEAEVNNANYESHEEEIQLVHSVQSVLATPSSPRNRLAQLEPEIQTQVGAGEPSDHTAEEQANESVKYNSSDEEFLVTVNPEADRAEAARRAARENPNRDYMALLWERDQARRQRSGRL